MKMKCMICKFWGDCCYLPVLGGNLAEIFHMMVYSFGSEDNFTLRSLVHIVRQKAETLTLNTGERKHAFISATRNQLRVCRKSL